MIEPLTFMMGEFEALIPTDRQYVDNHMWALPVDSADRSRFRFGFSAYAVRLLQDVYFLDWLGEAPADWTTGQEIGSIESKKAESSLYAPASGKLIELNQALMEDPSAINVDKYGNGWLFEMELTDSRFLNPAAYLQHLENVWEKTQRTIKGQLN